MKLNIFGYVDFRLFLKDYYDLQKRETRYFSYRYFSNKAGFSSHNVLKQVINGERNIAYNSIGKFCRALNLTPRECDYFRLMVLFNQSKFENEKNELFKEMSQYKKGSKVKKLSEMQYTIYSEWHHVIIREMLDFVEITDNYEKIARAFSPPLTATQVKKSLLLLKDIGLVKQDASGKWIQNDSIIKTAPEVESLSIRNFNRKMIALSGDAIEKIEPQQREISSMTLSVSKTKFKEIKDKIQKFKDEVLNDIVQETSPSEEVYQLNFQFFPVLRKNWQHERGVGK